MYLSQANKSLTGEVRLSYVHLAAPYKDENATSTFAFSEDGCDFYRIENRCVYCGKHRCWLQHVRIERNEL